MILHIIESFAFLPLGLNLLIVIAFVCFGIFIVIDIILSIIWVIGQIKNLFTL